MNYSTAIFLISDSVRAVEATYEADTEKTTAPRTVFKTLNSDIKVGDYVVVPTNTRHNMTVCKVAAVDIEIDLETTEEIAWIIGTVDRADFEDLKRQEDEAIAKIKSAEKRRKREQLRRDLLADAEDDLKALPIYERHEASE